MDWSKLSTDDSLDGTEPTSAEAFKVQCAKADKALAKLIDALPSGSTPGRFFDHLEDLANWLAVQQQRK